MHKQDRAILVALNRGVSFESTKNSIDELEALASALDIVTIEKVIQRGETIDPRFYIGSGKVNEIKQMIDIHDASIIIFDDTLSAGQIKNLEQSLDCQIIDRSFLILSIFSMRAKTKQAVLEVSLAQKLYLLPRLVGMTKSLSRQGGGSFNAKGPGETKLELNRRLLNSEISLIKKELLEIKKQREVSKKKRVGNQVPVVALVGYTNAGKSALMNKMIELYGSSDEFVFEKDMLFATLDTKAKRIKKENHPPFVLIDTVGFISKLPHELVISFESTLSDITTADLIIHVVDGLNPNMGHIEFVRSILDDLKASDIPRVMTITKNDLVKPTFDLNLDFISISSKTGDGFDVLLQAIESNLYLDHRVYKFIIPFDKGEILAQLKENNQVLDVQYLDDGIHIRASLSKKDKDKIEKYLL